MCHAEAPAGHNLPDLEREELEIPMPGGETLPTLLTLPAEANGAGVLVINDIFGRSPFYEQLSARLAAAGFLAAQPEYFFRQAPLANSSREAAFARRGQLDERQTVQDLTVALDWLAARPEVTAARLGTVGFCMGGTFVLNLAARRDDLASVCYYGFPAARTEAGVPTTAPLDELDQISGPILGFWGDQDHGVGMDNVAALADGLKTRGVDFEHTIYPGLGHGFMATSKLDPADPDGSGAYPAAEDAWNRTVAFYRRHLTGTPA